MEGGGHNNGTLWYFRLELQWLFTTKFELKQIYWSHENGNNKYSLTAMYFQEDRKSGLLSVEQRLTSRVTRVKHLQGDTVAQRRDKVQHSTMLDSLSS